MSDREHQVRECAYYLWEAEGRPEGRAQIHWTMAEIATTLFSYLNADDSKYSISSGCRRKRHWIA
jgi:hypothetical protein